MRDSRKKINKDAIISWIIDGKTVKKSYNERLKEVRSQAYQKTRDGDVIRACGYSTKGDGSIKASARVETKDAELETIFDEAKIESYLADKYGISEKVFKNFQQFLSGGGGDLLRSGNMGYIGNHPQLQNLEKIEQEKLKLKKKEIAQRDKLIELEERKIKLAEQGKPEKDSLVTELCDLITSAMQANVQVQPSKGKSSKPTPLGELRKIYPKWCEENLKFDPKLPPKKNKQYYRTDILLMWQESKEYGYWLDNHAVHGWDDPSQSEVTKVFSSTHTKLHVNIHGGNLPIKKKKH